MNCSVLQTSVILSFACLCMGCGSSEYPTVSGKVTYDGQPLANIEVVFSPLSDSVDTIAPYSTAVTDEAGVFSLKTRDGQLGAVVGQHRVGFAWSDIKSYTVRNLKQSLSEAEDAPERAAELKDKIAAAKEKLASRPTLKANLKTEFTVPAGGSDSANFELTDF